MMRIKLKHQENIIQSEPIEEGRVSVSLFKERISFFGYDRIRKKQYQWYESNLSENEEVVVEIINTQESPIPLTEGEEDQIKLRNFHQLKKYLTKEKLI